MGDTLSVLRVEIWNETLSQKKILNYLFIFIFIFNLKKLKKILKKIEKTKTLKGILVWHPWLFAVPFGHGVSHGGLFMHLIWRVKRTFIFEYHIFLN